MCFLARIGLADDEASTDATREETGKKETNANDSSVRRTAVSKGLDWLVAHQAEDGSWGKTYTVAVTSFGCLSLLGGR